MSMNLHLSASVEAILTIGKHTIVERFTLWQTPTYVTYAILDTDDPKSAYVEWVKEVAIDKEEAKQHIIELEEFINCHIIWHIEWYYL